MKINPQNNLVIYKKNKNWRIVISIIGTIALVIGMNIACSSNNKVSETTATTMDNTITVDANSSTIVPTQTLIMQASLKSTSTPIPKIEVRYPLSIGTLIPTQTRITTNNVSRLSQIAILKNEDVSGVAYEFRSVSFSPDGNLIAAGTVDSQIIMWTLSTGETRKLDDSSNEILNHNWFGVSTIDFSPDGSMLAATDSTLIGLWDVSSGNLIKVFHGHTAIVNGAYFCNSNDILISGGDQTIRFWNIDTGKEINHYSGKTNGITELSCTNDGKLFAFIGSKPEGGSSPSSLVIMMLKYWQEAYVYTIPKVGTYPNAYHSGLAFSEVNNLVAAQTDKGIQIWNTKTGQEIYGPQFSVRESPISLFHSPVVFSPDGNLLIYVNIDGQLSVWDILKKETIMTIVDGHKSFINSVDFSSDGTMIVSASNDGTVRIWGIK